MRADLTAYGGRCPVSRNETNLQARIVEILREHFDAIVEAVYQEFSRIGRPKAARPRSTNKLAALPQSTAAIRYINPFAEKWTFGKCPDWLLTRREPTAIEKHVYGKLLYPMPPICERWDQTMGIIFGLNQQALARALGLPRQSVNVAVTSLRYRGLIKCTGRAGAKLVVRFLWHEWIGETCQLNGQVADLKPATPADRPATSTDSTCPNDCQVAQGLEKRETPKEEENAQLGGDAEWLRTVVKAKFPRWPLEQLKLQWHQHRRKGKEEGKWIPGDRGHFLVAWMPRAGDDPPSSHTIAEPPSWWNDFISECYPDAKIRGFSQIQKFHPDVVKQGLEWASSRAISGA